MQRFSVGADRRWREVARFAVVVAMVGGGCAAPIKTYMHPDADLAFYTDVAVVPFRSLAADRFAGDKFTVEFETALMASELFNVMDRGVFANHLKQVVGSQNPVDGLTAEQLTKLAERTGVQGFFEGTVSQYELVPAGSGRFPVISVEARFVDASTGTVVWSATLTERGGPKTPLIGVGEIHTLGELSQKMCEKLIKQLK